MILWKFQETWPKDSTKTLALECWMSPVCVKFIYFGVVWAFWTRSIMIISTAVFRPWGQVNIRYLIGNRNLNDKQTCQGLELSCQKSKNQFPRMAPSAVSVQILPVTMAIGCVVFMILYSDWNGRIYFFLQWMSGTWQSLKTNKTCGLFSIVAFAYMAPQGISLSRGAGLRSGLLVASRQEGLEMVWYNQTLFEGLQVTVALSSTLRLSPHPEKVPQRF